MLSPSIVYIAECHWVWICPQLGVHVSVNACISSTSVASALWGSIGGLGTLVGNCMSETWVRDIT